MDNNEIVTKEELWALTKGAVADAIAKMVDANRDKDLPPTTHLLDSPVGSGKTHSAIQVLKDNQEYSCLFFTETKKRVNSIAEQIGGLAFHGEMEGRAKHKKADGGWKKFPLYDEYLRIKIAHKRIVITHATLKELCNQQQQIKEVIFSGYDCIIIDELYKSHRHFCKGVNEIQLSIAGLYPLTRQGNQDATKLADYILNLLDFKDGITLITGENKPDINFDNIQFKDDGVVGDADKLVDILRNNENNVLYVEKRNTGLWLVSADNLLPNSASFLILSDGLKRDGLTQSLSRWGNRKPDYIQLPRGDWSNYEYHYSIQNKTGKDSLESNLESVADDIKRQNPELPDNEKLIITHLQYEGELRALLPDFNITHYGLHRGTNEFKQCKEAYILTLLWKDATQYSANALAHVSDTEGFDPDKYESLNLPLVSIYQDEIQARHRAGRLPNMGTIKYYSVLPQHYAETILNWNKEDFPGMKLVPNQWMSEKLTKAVKKKIDLWAERFIPINDIPEAGLPASKLLKDKKYVKKWRDVRRSDWVVDLYDHLNIRIENNTVFKRG